MKKDSLFELLKQIDRLSLRHGHLTGIELENYSAIDYADSTRSIIEKLNEKEKSKKALATITRAVLISGVTCFKISKNDLQELIDRDPYFKPKVDLTHNGSNVWKGFTALIDKDLDLYRILVPSSKDYRKPAIVAIYNEFLWNDSGKNIRDIEDCFISSGYEVPQELQSSVLSGLEFKDYKEQIDKYLKRERSQSLNKTKLKGINESISQDNNITSENSISSSMAGSMSNPVDLSKTSGNSPPEVNNGDSNGDQDGW